MATPPSVARQAIDRGIGQVTRRIEVYEADGQTIWADGLFDRLNDGNVNLTYGDNERRSCDISLGNEDNFLRSNPDGFWYDKVIKLYRGINFYGSDVLPQAAIIERQGGSGPGIQFAAYLRQFGVEAKYFTTVPSLGELLDYDIVFSYTGTAATTQADLLKQLYDTGRSVVTISCANTTTQVPHLTNGSVTNDDWGISQPAVLTELSAGWTSEGVSGSASGTVATGVTGDAVIVARWLMNNAAYAITGSVAFNPSGGRWFDLHLPSLVGTSGSVHINQLMANGIKWLQQSNGYNWETQIGEFVIDGINGDYFPSLVKVTGRDYVKRCLNSKVENALSFDSGSTITSIVTALAANSGIQKIRLDPMAETIGSSLSFDRGTPRWDIMRQAASTNDYEIYFDNEGWLRSRKYRDTSTTPHEYEFKTGLEGNLSTLSRSTNDSRIYNHVVVYGDPPSGEQRMPYVAEAKNTEPSSPTRISRIGDRYYSYASTFFTSQAQCQEYANRLLKLHALESFELTFTAINYPWLEVGDIAKVVDPNAVASDPDRYLVDTAMIPLSLGPMSMTGKRITMVG